MTNVDYSSNANQRTPCVLVLDVSGSMETLGSSGKTRIQALNEGVAMLERSLREDDTAISRVQLAIVSVGGPANDADVMMDWTDAVNFKAFPLRTGGSTPLGKGVQVALQLIEEAKENFRDAGINYTRPWMMIISDGEPTDDRNLWTSAARESREAEAAKKVEVFCIGVEGANLSVLGELGAKPALMLDGLKFKELFLWLSSSLSAASRSRPGDTLQLADTGVWRNVRM
jgi:uncharacterized protein YegL